MIDELAPLNNKMRIKYNAVLNIQTNNAYWVETEPRYLHRALQNLMNNAMRYTKKRMLINYQVGYKHYHIDVEDDGPNMPKKT